jgi:hypothetical protein
LDLRDALPDLGDGEPEYLRLRLPGVLIGNALQPAARALLHLVSLAAILWGAAFVLTTSRWSMQLYRTWRFPGTQAHHLAAKLGDAQCAGGDVCLLFGSSSVREAFDEWEMHLAVPELRFLNGGTTGGTVFVYEAMSSILERSRVRPRCVVVGLNARILISRDVRLNAAGYTDFMDLRDRRLLDHEQPALREEAAVQLRANSLWPYNRFARHLGRLARMSLFAVRDQVSWGQPRRLEDFALADGELGRAPQHLYQDTEPLSGKALDRLLAAYREQGMYDPTRYAQPDHLGTLRQVLDRLEAITPHLIVMRMPESSYGRAAFAPFAEAGLAGVLAEYEARGVCVIDLTTALSDRQLRDLSHLLTASRPDFSRLAARRIIACVRQQEAI